VSSTALAAVLAKLAGLNVAGKVVVALAVAAGAVGAAGAAPAIADQLSGTPQTAQVATVEPTDAPTDVPTVEPTDAPTARPVLPGASTFGQQVAKDARAGGVDGQKISALARANAALHHSAQSHPAALPGASAFGQQVAKDARAGGVDGQKISALARANAALHPSAGSHATDSATAATGTGNSPGAAHATSHGKPANTPGGRN